MRVLTRCAGLVAALALLLSCQPAQSDEPRALPAINVIPLPLSTTVGTGPGYLLTADTAIRTAPGTAPLADRLAEQLRRSTGLPLPVGPATGGIELRLDPAVEGEEGYRLAADEQGVVITANTEQGLYRGTQTLRQLLPPHIDAGAVVQVRWAVPPVTVTDRPRYPYRGALLDVARHFFTVAEVKAFVDRLALYKFNHLHLHLSDDQGWRITVPGHPELTGIGAATEVGGTPGGFYTDADYREIVRYAQERFLTVVPEIDLPGHTNAALTAHPELDCSGGPPPVPYTGTEVGFSALCPTDERSYAFTNDVITHLAALTPGPYLHIGGDEVKRLEPQQYEQFVRRVAAQVVAAGKIPVGWHETAPAAGAGQAGAGQAGPGQVGLLQYWRADQTATVPVQAAVGRGAKVLMSPAGRTYLDMKYQNGYRLGLRWAGYVDVLDTYGWDPDTFLPGLPPGSVLGVEPALWTETLSTVAELDLMLLPRLPALAEVGWSAQADRHWPEFRVRLAGQALRWEAAGFAFERRPSIPWR
ncbi:beta-N-acetylhexosaminidase [Kitasatospora sp. NPDC002040]|uniref:beta-N-acetylhexosaminidase n=1 Tax=Kitasatospora sp. NPDC002040 TaxID=3154661 RepID=UPI003330A4D6